MKALKIFSRVVSLAILLAAAIIKQTQDTWYVAAYHDNAVEVVHDGMRYTVDVTYDSSLVTYVGQKLPNCKEGFTGLCIEKNEFGRICAHETDIKYESSNRLIAIRPE